MVHTMRGKEHVEWKNPYDVAMTGLIGFSSGYYAMLDCDVLLMLGTDFPCRQFYPQGRASRSRKSIPEPSKSGGGRRLILRVSHLVPHHLLVLHDWAGGVAHRPRSATSCEPDVQPAIGALASAPPHSSLAFMYWRAGRH
jgi:hypothetical protein